MKLVHSLLAADLALLADCCATQSASTRSLIAKGAGPDLVASVHKEAGRLDCLAAVLRLAVSGQLLLDVAGVCSDEAEILAPLG